MRTATAASALALRARLSPRSVVLVDAEGTLTASQLLALSRDQFSGGLARLEPGSLREILARSASPSVRTLEVRSSGTTGPADRQRRGPLSAGQLATLLDLARRIGMRPGRTIACAAPGEHGHGLVAAIGALVLGMRLVDVSRLSPDRAHELLRATTPDLLTGVPAHLLDLAAAGPLDIPRAISGSDVLTPQSRSRILEAGIDRVQDVYGTTETGSLTVDGHPLRGVRIREQEGLLLARTAFTGGREIATDRGEVTADGRVIVHGRADGAVSSGGMLHDPQGVAELILGLPEVRRVTLRTVADERLGTRTIAIIGVHHPRLESAELAGRIREHVRAEIGPHAVPREIRWAADHQEDGISTPGR